ncbi:MAG TPA: hypothetical protein VHB47_05950 [Thermoanaerobaculia bacterium]|jgi:hypothetical protein|nr:hypothetical protein [Thermoanaerobaculia bacterium]
MTLVDLAGASAAPGRPRTLGVAGGGGLRGTPQLILALALALYVVGDQAVGVVAEALRDAVTGLADAGDLFVVRVGRGSRR